MREQILRNGKASLFAILHLGFGKAKRSGIHRTPTKESRRGSILIVCLIILSTLTIYGLVLVSAIYERSLLVRLELDRLQALYLAESALAKSLEEVKTLRDTNGDGLGTIPNTALGRGTYYAEHDPGLLTIIGIGEVNGVRRRVRIHYAGI